MIVLIKRAAPWHALSALLVLLAGCGGDDPVGPVDPEDLVFAPELGVDLDEMTETASGLYYQVVAEGEGEEVVEEGDIIAVEYAGYLHTGQLFDSSTIQGAPYSFEVGSIGGAIAGVDEGVRGMRLNETRLFVVPHDLAYGAQGQGSIPRYATVVFEMTLVELDKEGG